MRRPAALLLIPLFFLAACGGDADTVTDTAAPDTADTETADPGTAVGGAAPTVTGAFGEAPTVELPGSGPSDELVVEVLEEGDGAEVADGDVLVADYHAEKWSPASTTEDGATEDGATDDGATDDGAVEDGAAEDAPAPGEVPAGEPFDTTFEGNTPGTFPMVVDSILVGMYEGLVGQTLGSRVLIVIPPEQGFGEAGQPQLGIEPDDSLVFVFDLVDAFGADAAAEGTPVEAELGADLPQIADGDDGPTVTVPSETPPPTELVTEVLFEGDGPVTEAGQFLVTQYRGVLWKDGSEFDSSWSRDQPTGFPIGTGGVIPGWDTGLVGQTVGSRVLLVVPPAEGYGPDGNPPTIAGDDTLVFVVDILGAYGPSQG